MTEIAARTARRGMAATLATLLALALVAGACTDAEQATEPSVAAAAVDAPTLPDDAADADFDTRTSVGQVTVLGAEAGTDLALYRDGEPVAVATTDDVGSLIYRELEPGDYRVATVEEPREATAELVVPSEEASLPEQSFYEDQVLEPGYTYITMRDGTTLSASVYLPGPVEDGPYPTVVEYSGYDPARPGGSLLEENADMIAELGLDPEALCEPLPFLCDSPAQPSSIIAAAFGYAVVAVNVRGTGCSGGAFDYFERLQVLDGYDVIETVAAQDWVQDNRVGMVGLSYPGISQLFVAQTQPPSLAAIAPMSVVDDTVRGVLAPGGIFNEGFALTWAREVLEKAEPLGQGWEEALVEAGDTTCADNQLLRGQNVDPVAKATSYTHFEPAVADQYVVSDFARNIDVPVFLSGSFQDEQTGGRFARLWDSFESAPVVRFNLSNGAHGDGYSPLHFSEFKTFLDLYVADRIPEMPPHMLLLAPVLMEDIFGADLTLEPVRFDEFATTDEARAAYEAEPPVRLLWESGAGDPDQPGAPLATVEYFLDAWPPSDVTASAWYLQPDGSMVQSPAPSDGGASRFAFDAELAESTTLPGDGVNDAFKALPPYEWNQEPEDSAAVFLSDPLTEDLVMAGHASADLWLRSSTPQADVGVTLSEVRPDGKETYIQSGVLRSSMRRTTEEATELYPARTGLEEDDEPMPVDEFAEVRVEIFPFAHVVRAGSRIRLSVHTPGGDRPRWSYVVADGQEGGTVDVGHATATPSRLVLPVTGALTGYPSTLPACPALRGQPCRDFVEYVNAPAP